MSDGTKIEWTDMTWNVVNGCSVLSPGCTNCYAMKQAHRVECRRGLTVKTNGGMVWTGEVRFNDKVLLEPLRLKRPRRIFVCAHGDLFHEKVPHEWIDQVFAVMALAERHTFQVLTKRPDRMRAYMTDRSTMRCDGRGMAVEAIWSAMQTPAAGRIMEGPWPLPNVWLGTSVEDQKRADERIPELLATPAAVRWISAEPLLGPIDLGLNRGWCTACNQFTDGTIDGHCMDPDSPCFEGERYRRTMLDWVVVGGESGPNARPMHPDWARSLRDQCAAAGVPFLFKQWGAWVPSTPEEAWPNPRSGWRSLDGAALPKASDLYQENGAAFVACVGKKAAGRLLDGVEHNGYPLSLANAVMG